MDYKDLGIKVRTTRRKAKITQEKLAEKANISASFLGHIERGTRVASAETLVNVCNALSVTPSYLLSASLKSTSNYLPEGVNDQELAKLSELLNLAQDTVQNWNVEQNDKRKSDGH